MTKSQKKILKEYLDFSKIELSEENLKIVDKYLRRFKDDDYSDWDKVDHAVRFAIDEIEDREYEEFTNDMTHKLENFKELTDDERKQIIDDLNYTSTDMVDNNRYNTKKIFHKLLLEYPFSDNSGREIKFPLSFFWLGLYSNQMTNKNIETANKNIDLFFQTFDTTYLSAAITNNPTILMTPFFQFTFLEYLGFNPAQELQEMNKKEQKLINYKKIYPEFSKEYAESIDEISKITKNTKFYFSLYKKIVKAVCNGLIPKGRKGRRTIKINQRILKKQYTLLKKELRKYLKNKGLEIVKRTTPKNDYYYKIPETLLLSTLIEKCNLISKEEIQFVKKKIDYMHYARVKNIKLERYEKINSVESLVKHIIAKRYNSTLLSIEKAMKVNKKKSSEKT